MVLIEMKGRLKSDAYMQASRGYEVTTESLMGKPESFFGRRRSNIHILLDRLV